MRREEVRFGQGEQGGFKPIKGRPRVAQHVGDRAIVVRRVVLLVDPLDVGGVLLVQATLRRPLPAGPPTTNARRSDAR